MLNDTENLIFCETGM